MTATIAPPATWAEPDTDQDDDLQSRATAVLLDLVSAKGLPRATWTVCAVEPGTLRGQIFVSERDDDRDNKVRVQVTQWAEMFDVPVDQTDLPAFGRVAMEARIDGVTVEVWGHVAPAVLKAVV